MGKHITPYKYPGALSSNRFAINGNMPHTGAFRGSAKRLNFIIQQVRRQIGSDSVVMGTPGGGSSGTTKRWSFLYRSGVNLGWLRYLIALAPMSPLDAGLWTDPYARVQLRDVDAATDTYSDEYRHHTTGAANFVVGASEVHWIHGFMAIPAEETLYRVNLELEDYQRAMAFQAWERAPHLADDTNTGIVDPTAFETWGDITGASIQDLLESCTSILQKNGPVLLQTNPGRTLSGTNTSWTNIMDLTTSVAATSQGAVLYTQYHDTRAGDIPCEFGSIVTRNSGTGTLEIRLQSASGTLCSKTGLTGTPNAHASAVTIVANTAETKYDIQARIVGTANFTIDNVSLWEYEA